jgi:hypothetical protein
MSKNKSVTPIWPMDFAGGKLEGSPIPSVQVIAASGRGKSTFAATIAPVPPGETPRTLVLDTENSYATLRLQFGLDVIDIRSRGQKRFEDAKGKKPIFQCIFEEVIAALKEIKPDRYDVIVIDSFSDVYMGTFYYLLANQHIFAPNNNYEGKMGVQMVWGDVRNYWKNEIGVAQTLCQTLVVVTHIKPEYDKSGNRTGKVSTRGTDITEAVSLKLWLFDERDRDPNGLNPGDRDFDGKRWAYVEKQRLTHMVWKDDDGNTLPRPRMSDVLPKKVIQQYPGQSFPEIIAQYLEKPSPGYGDLDKLYHDPARSAMTQEDREERESDRAAEETQKLFMQDKREMVQRLIRMGYYRDADQISNAVIDDPELTLLAGNVEGLPNLEAALRARAMEEPANAKRVMVKKLVTDGVYPNDDAVIKMVTGDDELKGLAGDIAALETALRERANGQAQTA